MFAIACMKLMSSAVKVNFRLVKPPRTPQGEPVPAIGTAAALTAPPWVARGDFPKRRSLSQSSTITGAPVAIV